MDGMQMLDQDQPPSWTPTEGVTTHAEVPIPPWMDFFAPPPQEIGPVLTAYSNLKTSQRSMSGAVRLAIGLVVGAAFYALVAIVVPRAFHEPGLRDVTRVIGVILGLGALGIVYLMTGFRHFCSYVGRDGVAQFVLSGSRRRPPKAKVLPFSQAASLFTHKVRNFYNGVYTGTAYTYRWIDPTGRACYVLKGNYRSKEDAPKPNSPYYLAAQAEIAWSNYLADRLQQQLDTTGYVEFDIAGRRLVRMAPGKIEFVFPDRVETLTTDEIGKVEAANGVITFKHKDARWFSGKGKSQFNYATIPNALLFLRCMDLLLGYRFQ